MLGQAPMVEIPEIDPNVSAMARRSQELMATPWFQMNLGQQKQAQAAPGQQASILPETGMGNMAEQFRQLGFPGQATPSPQAGTNAPAGDWLRYSNQNAIRNKPLSPELQQALSFAPEMGLTIEVFSGGETEDRKASNSGRHMHGNSGDMFLYQGDRRLDPSNPNDVPILQEFVRRAKAGGVTGVGAGDGYMQPGSLHVGFGKEAVWGAGGRGENAAKWLRDAWYS